MSTRMALARQAMEYKMIDDGVVLFDIQVARDITADDLSIDFTRIGPVRLPYPEIFMEFHEPMLYDDSRFADLPNKLGFLLTESDDHRRISMKPFYLYPDGPYSGGLWVNFSLNADGTLVTNNKGTVDVGVDWDTDNSLTIKTMQRITPVICATARVCLTALGLINCRNVRTPQLGKFPLPRSGSDKRRGISPREIRYSTIILPGGGSQRVGSGSSAHDRATAVHRVRGHCKTYTAEAPLLGKHVGTYWWGWQIRGQVSLGVVESDYTLGPSGLADSQPESA